MPFSAGATAAAGLSTGATLGVAAGVIAAEELIRKYVGRGRKAADAWVKNPANGQNAFLKNVLEPARLIAESDPEKAQQLAAEGWRTYLSGADAYASKGKNEAKVVQQNMFKTPDFINTVSGLLGRDPLGEEFTGNYLPGKTDRGQIGAFGKVKLSSGLGDVLARGIQAAAQPGRGSIIPTTPTAAYSTNPLVQAGQSFGFTGSGGSSQNSGNVGWLTPGLTGIPLWRGGSGNVPYSSVLPSARVPGASNGGTTNGAPNGGGVFDQGGGSNIPGSNASGGGNASHWWDRFIDPNFLLSVGTSLFGGIANARAARRAGEAQAAAAEKAAQLQADTAKGSLDFAKEVYGNQQQANAPFLTAGTNALAEAQRLIGPGGELSKDFTPPTVEQVRETPGYQLKLDAANKALERATRGVTSGQTIKAATRYNNDYADSFYNNETDRALNIFQTNRANRLNPLFQLAGFGPGAVSANNSAGNNAVSTNTGINSNLADNTGQLGIDAATARGYGNVNSTNALVAALTQISNLAQQRQAQTRSSY